MQDMQNVKASPGNNNFEAYLNDELYRDLLQRICDDRFLIDSKT